MSKPQIPVFNPPDANVVEPTTLTKNTGHVPGERPPAQYHNWLFRALSRCVQYLVPRATDAWARVSVSGGTPTMLKGSGLVVSGVTGSGVALTFDPAEEGDANYGVTVTSCNALGGLTHWYVVSNMSASGFTVTPFQAAAGGGGVQLINATTSLCGFTVKVMRG